MTDAEGGSPLEEEGLGEEAVFGVLAKRLRKDAGYGSGKVLSSMCSEPLELARRAYSLALEKNLGDESLFPGTVEIEREAVSMLGAMLSNPHAVGHVVSGGTEANITALWVARNLDQAGRREVVLPESAHFSFETAADLLGLKLVKTPLTNEFRSDPSAIRKALSRKTLAIIGVAGSTGLGAVDPILELSDIALENDVHLHIDAAFGGFVLPFLKDLGLYEGVFDFEAPGVKSITVDPHKMGLCPIPAGGILLRNPSLLSAISRSVDYIGRGRLRFTTLACSRPGPPAIAVWTALKHLGRRGYREIVERCMENTIRLAADLERLEGVHLLMRPSMNIVGFTCPGVGVERVFDALSERGWRLSLFTTHIRVMVMPHTEARHLKAFVSDLEDILTSFKGSA